MKILNKEEMMTIDGGGCLGDAVQTGLGAAAVTAVTGAGAAASPLAFLTASSITWAICETRRYALRQDPISA